jgi:hypothetical protein
VEVPNVRRRLRLYPHQWLALPLLFAIPVAAIAGAFGERSTSLSVAAHNIEVHLRSPRVFRYRQLEPLQLSITNRSPAALPSLSITFDTAYVARFARVRFIPEVTEPYIIQLDTLPPGATTIVMAELEGARYGSHRGAIYIQQGRKQILRLPLRTWVLP